MVDLSGKTQEYLTRATQRYYGKTPMQMINDIRINFAKKQLEITNYSVTDIAYESGYSSPSLFIKTFKKLTSFTPAAIGNISPVLINRARNSPRGLNIQINCPYLRGERVPHMRYPQGRK